MCYTGWCQFEQRIGPSDIKCIKPASEECPLDKDSFDNEDFDILKDLDESDEHEYRIWSLNYPFNSNLIILSIQNLK